MFPHILLLASIIISTCENSSQSSCIKLIFRFYANLSAVEKLTIKYENSFSSASNFSCLFRAILSTKQMNTYVGLIYACSKIFSPHRRHHEHLRLVLHILYACWHHYSYDDKMNSFNKNYELHLFEFLDFSQTIWFHPSVKTYRNRLSDISKVSIACDSAALTTWFLP